MIGAFAVRAPHQRKLLYQELGAVKIADFGLSKSLNMRKSRATDKDASVANGTAVRVLGGGGGGRGIRGQRPGAALGGGCGCCCLWIACRAAAGGSQSVQAGRPHRLAAWALVAQARAHATHPRYPTPAPLAGCQA
jgi:hypothetical protein